MGCLKLLSFLFLAALAYGVSPASSQSSFSSCREGSNWNDGCNTCFCSNGVPICTLAICFDSQPPEPIPDSSSCVDGSTWQQDCNTCQCFGGAPICTLRACGGFGFRRSKSLARSSPSPDCEVTDSTTDRWRQSCNWCRCLNGRGVCDRKGCPPDFDTRSPDTPQCEGNARWKKDCNWCSCVDGVGFCDQRACFNRADFPALNKPRNSVAEATKDCEVTNSTTDRWWQECNACRCVEGRGVCTRRGCPPNFAVRYPEAPQCEGSPRWKEGSTWCSCVDDKAVCGDENATGDSGISEEDSLENKECTSGSIWNDGCNKCVCLETGVALCTRRACPPNQYPSISSSCKEKSRWREGCTKCACSFGVGVCTFRNCETKDNLQTEPSPVSAISTRILASRPSPSTNIQEAEKIYTCSEGSRWLVDACNWCDCEGGKAICTSDECTSDNSVPSNFTCISGSSWHDGCNGCSCMNGRSLCTLMFCTVQVSEVPTEAVESDKVEEDYSPFPKSKCIDGTSWSDECNRCHCHNGGYAACTKKICSDFTDASISNVDISEPKEPLNAESIQNPIDNRDCVPGSRYKLDECNWCSCTETGRGVCTLMACFRRPGTESQIGKCEEGSRWRKDSCNWCNCRKGFGVCTAMACFSDLINRAVPMISNEVSEEPTLSEDEMCLAGSHFRKDCNWCNCNNGRSVCTKRRCRPEPLQRSSDCTGISVWREDCNICICNEAGFGSCTRKLCGVRRESSSRPVAASPVMAVMTRTKPAVLNAEDIKEKECNQGSRWKVDCNTCTCTNSGISRCTRMKCEESNDDILDEEQECLTGSYFRAEDGCNWCYCSNGTKACTAKACSVSRPKPLAVATSFSNKPTERTHTECEPGTTWQEECNTCTCNGGRSYCTVRACFSSIRDIRPVSARERCRTPAQSGTCRAGFKMFAFNSDRNRCEMFLYGGCGGNDNKFVTAEDCHRTCGGDAPVIDSSCDRKKCESRRQDAFMASKNCKPVYAGGNCCATSYSCSEESLPKKSCVGQRGEELVDDREKLHSIGESQYYCRGGVLKCHYSEKQCSYDNIIEKNCRSTFTEGRCCASGYACYYDDDVPLCRANGKDYYEGNKMFFEGSDSSQFCLCSANYTGPYGEGCRIIDCNYDTLSATQVENGCVPFFANNSWCPDGYLCPGASVLDADQSGSNPEGKTEDVCTFADITVARGHQLAISDGSLNCSCQTPPMITCTRHFSDVN